MNSALKTRNSALKTRNSALNDGFSCAAAHSTALVDEEAIAAQRTESIAERSVVNLNVIAAGGVVWLMVGWTIAMILPAIR